MTYEEISKAWAVDGPYDRTVDGLIGGQMAVPDLFNRYYAFYRVVGRECLAAEQKYKDLRKKRKAFLRDGPSKGDTNSQAPEILYGWTLPEGKRILESKSLEEYLDSDTELWPLLEAWKDHERTVKYLEGIIKLIHDRHWQIKNINDTYRWSRGQDF